MKAWKCSAMDEETAAFTCGPKECGAYSDGLCGNRPVLGPDGFATDDDPLPCDAVAVEITPAAEAEARDAAIRAVLKAGDEVLEVAYGVTDGESIEAMNRRGENVEIGNFPTAEQMDALRDALAALRAAEGKE